MHLAGRRSRRVLVAGLIAVVILAASATGIFAALGGFSRTTVAQPQACIPSTTALTTTSGAQVLTGHTKDDLYCVDYRDPKGARTEMAGRTGSSPVVLKAFDTVSDKYVIAGVVPPGYTTITVGSTVSPIQNQAFAVDAATADRPDAPAVLSGPAGSISLKLRGLPGLPAH
jgi:hypothetical protein